MIKFKAFKYTTGKTAGQAITAALLCGFLIAALISGCKSSPAAPDNSPAFSDMAPLGGNFYYVAFKSPDLEPGDRRDTVKISFSYNVSKIKSIAVRATLDSQKTWIHIGAVTPQSSGKAAVTWIPKDSPAAFAFFDRRETFVRVVDTVSNEHIDSDSFFLFGSIPYVLYGPKPKETFRISDTIPISFSRNQDRSTNVSVGFLVPSDSGWDKVDIVDRTETVSESRPIKTFLTKFVPQDFSDEAGNYPAPITIFIGDYGGGSKPILKADSIVITR
jgi:hypothetical protein